MGDGGRDLLHKLQPFGTYAELGHERKSGNVAAWPRKAFDDPLGDWIDHSYKHDRERGSGLLRSCNALTGKGQNNVRPGREQFRGRTSKGVSMLGTPTWVDTD